MVAERGADRDRPERLERIQRVFDGPGSVAGVEITADEIGAGLAERFGVTTPVIVKSARELQAIVNGNPIVPTAGATTATTTVSLAAPPFSTATQAYFRVTSLP